ncbi:6-phosphogluconolactonase [Bacteroidota bacterium]
MKQNIRIFEDPNQLADEAVKRLINYISEKRNEINIALSGGSTPKIIYSKLAEVPSELINWTRIKLWWGDERCVSPDDPASNYGMAKNLLIDKIKIPPNNIYPIIGDNDPYNEVKRYSNLIEINVPKINQFPCFDVVILGLGEDGHTASIFPDQIDNFFSQNYCEVTYHPESNLPRITLTGNIINNANLILFIATGENKTMIFDEVINNPKGNLQYPAALVKANHGQLEWYVDSKISLLLK